MKFMSAVLHLLLPTAAFCVARLQGRKKRHCFERDGKQVRQKGAASTMHTDDRRAAMSERGQSIVEGTKNLYLMGWNEAASNPYDPVHNPQGCIQLGLAENLLSVDLVEEWLSKHKKSLTEIGDGGMDKAVTGGSTPLAAMSGYQEYRGTPSFRKALSLWMHEVYEGHVDIDPNNLVTATGCTAITEMLTTCLADSGDVILAPAPFYPGFVRDVQWRTGVSLQPISCDIDVGFAITRPALERAMEDAEASGKRVRAVLLSSPSNPVGVTYSEESLLCLLSFAREANVHVICDEIFAGCVFAPPRHISILEVMEEQDEERVHVVYGLSKDLGLAGFRVGALYTKNASVRAAASAMARFCCVSSQTQETLVPLLSSSEFARNYLKRHKERLRMQQAIVTEYLSKMTEKRVEYVAGNSGLYVWVNLSPALQRGEDGKAAEDLLFMRFLYEAAVNINCGFTCGLKYPGWFRICFAAVDENTLRVGLQRILRFMENEVQRT